LTFIVVINLDVHMVHVMAIVEMHKYKAFSPT